MRQFRDYTRPKTLLKAAHGKLDVTKPRRVREVVVVPVKEEAFAAARKLHVYAVPIARSTSDVSYIAFYRGAPTSAITHYAKVIKISKNMSFQEVFPGGSSILLPEDSALKVYHLDPIVELQRRVKKGRNPPISGPRYTKMERLTKARYLDEIWPPEETAKAKDRGKSRTKAKAKEADAPKKGRASRGGKAAKEAEPKKKGRAERTKGAEPPRTDTKKTPAKRTRKASKTKEKPSEPKEVPEPAPKRRRRGKKKSEATEEPEAVPKPSVHYIVDGSNVALEARTFKEGGRLSQIELLTTKLEETEGAAVTVIVDANLRHHIDRKDDMEVMIKDRRILQAPAQTDADEFILLTAEFHRSKGETVVIVSNDRFQDYIKKFKPRFDWVKSSQQKFMFVFSHEGSEVVEAMISIS